METQTIRDNETAYSFSQLQEMIADYLGSKNVPRRFRIITDTSDFFKVDYNDVVILAGVPYLMRNYTKEGRFGLDDEPKYWVRKAVNLETREVKIIKLTKRRRNVVVSRRKLLEEQRAGEQQQDGKDQGGPQPGQGVDYGAPEPTVQQIVSRIHPRRMRLRVREVIQATPTTKTFHLERLDGPLPPFRAGQYVNVFVDVDGVLTDGTLVFTATGEAAKQFHVLFAGKLNFRWCSC